MYFNSIDAEKQVSLDSLEGVDGIKIQWLLSHMLHLTSSTSSRALLMRIFVLYVVS